jgi:RecB family endonuclease NucS
MIFSISGTLDKAEKIPAGKFTDLNIWERKHIEQWVDDNPEILGEELLILTSEFDRFVKSSDRLDVLALDRVGNLVVIELKRDSLAG